MPVVLALGVAPILMSAAASGALHGDPGAFSPPKAGTAPKPPVTVAEVESRVDAASLSLQNPTELLKKDVEAEIAALDWSKAPARRLYKLSAAIVALESTKIDGKMARTSCTVSVSIREAKGGTLLAIMQGRARVEDALTASAGAQRDALTGAVRGAVAGIPEAIRSAH
jgi:hypothetical protein